MATINRAPWNSLVDDDGSNLVGSIWNKAAIKTVLLDPIDVAIAGTWASAALGSGMSDDAGTTLSTVVVSSRYVRIGTTTVIWQMHCDAVTLPVASQYIYLNYPASGGFNQAHENQRNPVTYSTLNMYVTPAGTLNRFRMRKNDFTNIAAGSYYFGFTSIWEVAP